MTEDRPLSAEGEAFFERALVCLRGAGPHYASELARLFDEMTAGLRLDLSHESQQAGLEFRRAEAWEQEAKRLRKALEKKTAALQSIAIEYNGFCECHYLEGKCVGCIARATLSEKGDGW